jgi:hypothetical protein
MKDNIKLNRREIGSNDIKLIQLEQHLVQRRTFVKTIFLFGGVGLNPH